MDKKTSKIPALADDYIGKEIEDFGGWFRIIGFGYAFDRTREAIVVQIEKPTHPNQNEWGEISL